MLNFYDLLQEIKKRPTLYLAKYSIFDFQSFYHGYELRKRKSLRIFCNGFARYIQLKQDNHGLI